MNKYTKPTLQKLEAMLKSLEYIVRYETGSFNSGYCIVENTKVIVINKFFDTDGRVNVIMDILENISWDESKVEEKTLNLLRNLIKQRESTSIKQEE
jgi:hypothetical protein